MGAVDGLPAGDELEEEDAEGEHVRLLVHDAMREVLRRQTPAVQPPTKKEKNNKSGHTFALNPGRRYQDFITRTIKSRRLIAQAQLTRMCPRWARWRGASTPTAATSRARSLKSAQRGHAIAESVISTNRSSA